ncbi:uncharacterized protein RAG0_00042 [Rhynchosporium agropyri]|uniref:Uncharacterized protein n=1 Tax=Rhynchosporium agropyri TaxID=914238 RepID=A0A1E1JRQ2_9HELO|nr:uncharacterized protein RAG0_00042 [Rhynchosporium agropyri]
MRLRFVILAFFNDGNSVATLSSQTAPPSRTIPMAISLMEKTWDDINVLHSLAPVREKMGEEDKVTYRLLDSVRVNAEGENGTVIRHVYWSDGGSAGTHTVIIFYWKAGLSVKRGHDTIP